MKVWGTALFLSLAACAAPSRAARPAAEGPEEKGFVDALRVEREYRPTPQGSEVLAVFYELPPNAYIAQGWAYDCWPAYGRRDCGWEASYLRWAPISYGLYRPYSRRRFCD